MNGRILNSLTHGDLVLPDGRAAASLRLGELWRSLSTIGTPGITPDMGRAALLDAYRKQIEPAVAKLRPDLGRRPVRLDVQVMRQAAAMIAGAA